MLIQTKPTKIINQPIALAMKVTIAMVKVVEPITKLRQICSVIIKQIKLEVYLGNKLNMQ